MTQAGQPTREVRFLGSATNELARTATRVEKRCADLAQSRAEGRSIRGDPVLVTLTDVEGAKLQALEEILGGPRRWQRVVKCVCSIVGGGLLGAVVQPAFANVPHMEPWCILVMAVCGVAMIAAAAFMEWRWR
jgi:hypothetical protein